MTKTPKFQTGDLLRVTGNSCFHTLTNGDIVKVLEVNQYGGGVPSYFATKDQNVTVWTQNVANHLSERDVELVAIAPKVGDKVRVKEGVTYHKDRVGQIGTYAEVGNYWSAMSVNRHGWIVMEDGARLDFYNRDLERVEEPVKPAFKKGDRIIRNGEVHTSGGREYGFREAPEGTLGTVLSVNYFGPDNFQVRWDHTGRTSAIDGSCFDLAVIEVGDTVKGNKGGEVRTGILLPKGENLEYGHERTVEVEGLGRYYIDESTMELVAKAKPEPEPEPVTEADILTLSKAFHDAEATHAMHEERVDSYTEALADAEADMEKAAAEREDAFAALQDALTRFKG